MFPGRYWARGYFPERYFPGSGSDGGGGLTVMAHPDYVLTYTEDDVLFAGDNPPLKWTITRKDGTNVAVPSAAAVSVKDTLDSEVDSLTPDLESAVPAIEQVLAALWSVRPRGTYTAQLTVTIGTDNQIRSDRVILTSR